MLLGPIVTVESIPEARVWAAVTGDGRATSLSSIAAFDATPVSDVEPKYEGMEEGCGGDSDAVASAGDAEVIEDDDAVAKDEL